MICCALSDKGPVRDKNEDSYGFEQIGDYMCMAVADGLGGEVCGEIASSIAVKSVLSELNNSLPGCSDENVGSLLTSVFNKANVKILLDCAEHRERIGMCTTLTAALVKGQTLTIAHIGDTRCYLCHGKEIRRLTQDHNQAAQLVIEGSITGEEAKVHPGRNRLVKVLGENQFLHPDIYSYNIIYGDLVVLCSDGLYAFLNKEDWASALRDRSDLNRVCQRLIDSASSNRSTDNMTVLIGNTSLKA
ncbi:MAG: serine/threonine-protein phosphatase [Clostridiales bacterium]|nr:serine/threonine-protein phosphatase [Clostridiales bacterium]